jgi:predicted metal-dependent RNase
MNRYRKTREIATDLMKLCKKHNVTIMSAPDMIKSKAKNTKLIKDYSMMNIFILDGDKNKVQGEVDIENQKARNIRAAKQFKKTKHVGSNVQYNSSVVVKLNRKKK